jgi:capsular exopolysaccharide synthesis family protein
MTLFDKPFRHVPSDPADPGSDVDVAVVDSVTAADDAHSTPAVAEPLADAAAERDTESVVGPVTTSVVEPLVIETPGDEIPVVATPMVATPVVATPVIAAPTVPAPEAIVPVAGPVELVRHEEHALAPVAEPGSLIVFSRVVPAQGRSAAAGDMQRLISAIDESEPVLDQLRSLAASLHQARTGRELKVIAVTSSVSGEGKTLLAANLALTLSRSYMRQVLMIDADLRRPNLHRLFGIASQDGIRTALDSVREGKPVAVQEVAPRLALLPAGRPMRDPISVLASDAMQRLMAGANAAFDWIVIDTPPVGMLPDLSLLSSLSDAVLLVVESGRVRFDLVQRTVESVGADRIFGVVLNKVPESDIVAAYGMHYYAPYR